ncbi:helix-turn-helix domain-containing protein [Actinacidiphila sp. ITFR-21]|uniref:helix-turn-helix domain-containing protein n=1 Tax=Actinacidiphila sp. ITFR-21 TaxID=3075199 RepID=UPI00288A1AB1|nr:DNA-binding protein [Streptomyces sp. ITFR-21]WNI16682.1 DNA-binding protein [Streptomyces sp. ITFR-21]
METSVPGSGARAVEAMELQRGWYGEPLGDLFRRLMADLGLNQVRLAGVLGLSAPMLSQLMSGQRAKIGNPAVVQRLQALQELAFQVAEGGTGAMEAAARMAEIRESAGTSVLSTTHSVSGTAAPADARQVVRGIQTVLRSVASAAEIEGAAHTLAYAYPQLAEFLRVYGGGRTGEAVTHYEAHQD